jgi:hypothetical protein
MEFSDLKENTSYGLFARKAGTNSVDPSAPSMATMIRTLNPITEISITGIPWVGETLVATVLPEGMANVTYHWYRNSIAEANMLQDNTTNRYITVEEDNQNKLLVQAVQQSPIPGEDSVIINSEGFGPIAIPSVPMYAMFQKVDGSWGGTDAIISLERTASGIYTIDGSVCEEYLPKGTVIEGFEPVAYIFTGEEAERNEAKNGDTIVIPKDTDKLIIHMARKSFTMEFDTDGGTEIDSITALYGAAIDKPEKPPEKEFHIFRRWTLNGEEALIPDTMPAGNRTYKAVWEGTVRCELTGKAAAKFQAEISDETIKAIAGEQTAALENGESIVLIIRVEPKDNPSSEEQTLIRNALAEKNAKPLQYMDISVYLQVGDNEPVPITSKLNAKIKLILSVSKDNQAPDKAKRTYYIARIHDSKAKVITNGTTENNVPFESDLFSTYALGASDEYTITFDTDGGTSIASMTRISGTTVNAPEETTSKEGYTFTGWEPTFPMTMPDQDITVKAKWKVNQYTITFDTDGGNTITAIKKDFGAEVTAPADPTKTGYTFTGWDKTIPEKMPAENMTIKAKWKINQYTIVFDSDGGSAISPITQDYGTTIKKPANPTRSGYSFTGWSPTIPEKMPAENLTVKAQWKKNEGAKGVNTGDDSNMPLWIGLLVLLVVGMVGFNVYRKKKRN